jgi:two-component system response regulator YesN
MFKVLIIDDEPLIREGLRTIVNWEELGFIICGEAVNGKDGVQKVLEQSPDLVIADIKMPVVDGIEMIGELYNRKIKCKYLILSGYSDFAYAQTAIRMGVTGYILKPIDKAELTNYVTKVYSELKSERLLGEKIKESLKLSRRSFIESLLSNNEEGKRLYEAEELDKVELNWKTYQVALVETDIKGGNGNILRKLLEQFVEGKQLGYVFDFGSNTGVLLKDSDLLNETVNVRSCRLHLKEKLGLKVFFAVGTVAASLEEVTDSFEQAKEIFGKRFLFGSEKGVVNYKVFMESSQTCDSEEEKSLLDSLYVAVDTNNLQSITEALDKKMHFMMKMGHSEEYIKASYINLYIVLINRLLISNKSLLEYLSDNEGFILDLYEKSNLEDLNDLINIRLVNISNQLSGEKTDTTMKKIIDFVKRNYASDIKLDTIAHNFNYNSAYLGRLFKVQTGEHFNTFLDRLRVDKAKQMLSEGYKVYQVAEMVGYKDKDYFASKFKKYVGVAPATYRNEGEGKALS